MVMLSAYNKQTKLIVLCSVHVMRSTYNLQHKNSFVVDVGWPLLFVFSKFSDLSWPDWPLSTKYFTACEMILLNFYQVGKCFPPCYQTQCHIHIMYILYAFKVSPT